MPKPPATGDVATATRKRKVDWKQYGARQAEDGERVKLVLSDIGDTVTGLLARVAEVNTRFGAKVLAELDGATGIVSGGQEAADGDYVFWPTPGAVQALDACEADEGDHITLTLTELVDTNKGNPYKVFEATIVDPQSEPF